MQNDLPVTEAPLCESRFKVTPEDFQVDELMPIEPEGSGEHVWLQICKRNLNTLDVASKLSHIAGVSLRDIGYSGLKDRYAITTQWFSVYLPKREAVPDEQSLPDGIQVPRQKRNARKLRRRTHRGNMFNIRLRDTKVTLPALEERLAKIIKYGVPNYFGEQRFGHARRNIDKAVALYEQGKPVRGIYLSAARAWLFNLVLAVRVTNGSWNWPLQGEVLSLEGCRSFFLMQELNETLVQRIKGLDVHPSGPLWGCGTSPCRGEVLRLESEVRDQNRALARVLEYSRMQHERRALRVTVRDLTWQYDKNEGNLQLQFVLPPGCYATAIIREVVRYPA